MINFWAIWCAPCRAEMADLDAVYRQYRDKGVVILAVNVAENSSDISTFATNMGLTLPIFRDSQQRITKAYNINALPTTFFIDRQGQMRRRQIGMMSRDFMVQQIESLLH